MGVLEGDIIAGKYRVDRILGSGGMGVVVAARHLGLDELVAIKLLLPEALADTDTVRRFEREARAAVKIKSEHVARIIDVGTLPDGAPFIVMEYLRGEDLAARVARTGPLAVADAIELILQACEAMAEAHALGIVHRDLKPANLFCVRGADGRLSIKVLDFGISKFTRANADNSAFGVTKTSAVVGSPFYMSPEQMQSPRTVDARTDVWAMGIILFQLLTGDVPFAGETFPQICVNVATQPAPSLRRLRANVPVGLEAVALRCLEKDPSKRYPSVAALAAALGPFGSRRAQVSLERIARTTKIAGLHASDASSQRQELRSDRPVTGTVRSWGGRAESDVESTRLGWAGSAAVVVSLVVVFVGLVWAVREPAASVTASRAVSAKPSWFGLTEAGAVPSLAIVREQASPGPAATMAAQPGPAETRSAGDGPSGGSALASPIANSTSHRSGPPPSSNRDPAHSAAQSAGANSLPEARPKEVTTTAETCIFNFNSIPASSVVLDGSPLGFTPKTAVPAASGEHQVLFVAQDGDTKATTATCAPGEIKTIAVRLADLPAADEPPANPYR